MTQTTLNLNGFTFHELFHADGLSKLDTQFLSILQAENDSLHNSLIHYRNNTATFSKSELSDLLIQWAIVAEDFLIDLFSISTAADQLRIRTLSDNPISAFKKVFCLATRKETYITKSNLTFLPRAHNMAFARINTSAY